MIINELIISNLVIKNKQTIDVHPTRINKTKTKDRQQFPTRKCALYCSLNSEKLILSNKFTATLSATDDVTTRQINSIQLFFDRKSEQTFVLLN
jgi:hypothetical protein